MRKATVARLDAIRERVFDAYAIVGVVAATFRGDVPMGTPEYGRVLRGVELALDEIAGELELVQSSEARPSLGATREST